MLITNELMERLEKISEEEVTLAKVMKDNAKLAVDFSNILMEKYRFRAKEDKILIAYENIKDEKIKIKQLKVYYTHSHELVMKSGNELYFQLDLSDFHTLYYCMLSKYFFNNDKYEFDKKVNAMYYDEKLAKIGFIIEDVYNIIIAD